MKQRKEKTVKGNRYDNKEQRRDTTKKYAEHDPLSWFVLGRKPEATSASKKHTNQNDENKSE
jgi:hypothetical protein